MKTNPACRQAGLFLTAVVVFISFHSFSQGGWTLCNAPPVTYRVDDIFMLDSQTGYAVEGGYILKSTDGGNNWFTLRFDSIWCRSVEFVNTQKGFVGAFEYDSVSTSNILRMTTDGGSSWIDLTLQIDPRARKGICGLSIPDSNTIYGCGNWFQDSAYIVKSIDGGSTWSFIDMHMYAASLIDMHFLDKDTGFATGRSPLPLETGIILYTTDGGQTWTTKFQDTLVVEYCWKIQHLTDQIYFASLQNLISPGRILKSTDGGMNWNILITPLPLGNGIQGVGFIDSLRGWTGGGWDNTFESLDGGITWDTIAVCDGLNRVFKVNDTLLFASGVGGIWKYSSTYNGISHPAFKATPFASLNCFPNPVSKNLHIDLTLLMSTHVLIMVLDENGRRIKVTDNSAKSKGIYKYTLDTEKLSEGIYHVVLKTHQDDQVVKVVVTH